MRRRSPRGSSRTVQSPACRPLASRNGTNASATSTSSGSIASTTARSQGVGQRLVDADPSGDEVAVRIEQVGAVLDHRDAGAQARTARRPRAASAMARHLAAPAAPRRPAGRWGTRAGRSPRRRGTTDRRCRGTGARCGPRPPAARRPGPPRRRGSPGSDRFNEVPIGPSSGRRDREEQGLWSRRPANRALGPRPLGTKGPASYVHLMDGSGGYPMEQTLDHRSQVDGVRRGPVR